LRERRKLKKGGKKRLKNALGDTFSADVTTPTLRFKWTKRYLDGIKGLPFCKNINNSHLLVRRFFEHFDEPPGLSLAQNMQPSTDTIQ
jgi:hypothetical protein